mgnify:FL=1|jgi:hypothetical protein
MIMDLSKLKVTPTPTRQSKREILMKAISKQAKMSNPAYLNAIEKNKRTSLYNQMILRLSAEVNDTKREQIIAEYIRNKG